MNSQRRHWVLGLLLASFFVALHLWVDRTPVARNAGEGPAIGRPLLGALQGLEGRALDLKFRLRGERAPHPDVLVAVVDESGVQRFGRWPWPRDRVAEALQALMEGGAASVGLDMIFTDQAPDSPARAYRDALLDLHVVTEGTALENDAALKRYRAGLEERMNHSPDARLAQVFGRWPEIVQGVVAYGEHERKDFRAREGEFERQLRPHMLTQLPGKSPGSVFEVPWDRVQSLTFRSAQTPLPILGRASPRWGHFNVRPDPDGTLRRLPLFVKLEQPEGLLPSLALQTAAAAEHATVSPVWDAGLQRLVAARLDTGSGGTREIPIELSEPFTLINFPGAAHVFSTISLADLIDGRVPPEALAGKRVLVGVSLLGAYDQVVTPFAAQEPGIYTHAALLSNFLKGDFLRRPPELPLGELGFIGVTALLLAALLPRVRFRAKVLLGLVLVAGYITADLMLFMRGLQLATVIPLLSVLGGGVAQLFVGYLGADRDKERLRGAFSHYLNPSVMDEMLAHPERLQLGGEKREMTVLFSDIRGFTSISEQMEPQALVRFINSYLNPMTGIVLDQGGTLDKYIGDALMAFWGAPVEQPDHPLRACRAALLFLSRLEQLKEKWREAQLPELDIGVGINSGPMVVGNMGSDLRFDYTVMGDAVNLASRLEGANKEYGTRILLSEETQKRVAGEVVTRRLGEVKLKGKTQATRVFELRAMGQPSPEEQTNLWDFETALTYFETGRPDDAEQGFRALLSRWEDGPTRHYLSLLEERKPLEQRKPLPPPVVPAPRRVAVEVFIAPGAGSVPPPATLTPPLEPSTARTLLHTPAVQLTETLENTPTVTPTQAVPTNGPETHEDTPTQGMGEADRALTDPGAPRT